MIYVDSVRCTGCGECPPVCPDGAITIPGETAVIDEGLCSGCEACLEACPEGAILMVEAVGSVPVEHVASALVPAAAGAIQSQPGRATPALREWAVPAIGSALLWTGRQVAARLASLAVEYLERRSEPAERVSLAQGAECSGRMPPRQASEGRRRRSRRRARRNRKGC